METIRREPVGLEAMVLMGQTREGAVKGTRIKVLAAEIVVFKATRELQMEFTMGGTSTVDAVQ